MTITPPSRSQRLDAMGAPGGRKVCRRVGDSVKEEAVYGTGCTGVRTMEVGESIGGMEVCSGFPRVVANAIALPLDEVVEFATHDPAVKHLFDFELFMVIDDLRRRGRSRATTRERIGGRESELYDREDGDMTTGSPRTYITISHVLRLSDDLRSLSTIFEAFDTLRYVLRCLRHSSKHISSFKHFIERSIPLTYA